MTAVFHNLKPKYVTRVDVPTLTRGRRHHEGFLLKRYRGVGKAAAHWRLVHASIHDAGDGAAVMYYANHHVQCDVGTTKRLPLRAVEATLYRRRHLIRLTVVAAGSGRLRGSCLDLAVPEWPDKTTTCPYPLRQNECAGPALAWWRAILVGAPKRHSVIDRDS